MSEVVAVLGGLQRYRGDFMGVFASPGEGWAIWVILLRSPLSHSNSHCPVSSQHSPLVLRQTYSEVLLCVILVMGHQLLTRLGNRERSFKFSLPPTIKYGTKIFPGLLRCWETYWTCANDILSRESYMSRLRKGSCPLPIYLLRKYTHAHHLSRSSTKLQKKKMAAKSFQVVWSWLTHLWHSQNRWGHVLFSAWNHSSPVPQTILSDRNGPAPQ